ncbi:molybdopterin binding aldehyde oxidase/xanthine dehydrogenase, partial [Tuber borchii]
GPPNPSASGPTANEALSPLMRITDKGSCQNLYVNGTKITLTKKLRCGVGGCGACTVVVHDVRAGGRIEHLAINSCLAPVLSVEGKHVLTIEALGTTANPHPLQERIAKLHDSQCGFCTPGIVMSLYALLRNAEEMVELEGALDGNLCRYTGYKPILDAVKSFAREDLGSVVFEGEKKTRIEGEDELNGNYISGAKGSGVGGCGLPDGCCKDFLMVRLPADGGSSGDTGSSSETDIIEAEEIPLSDAACGTSLKTCGCDYCCQLPSGGNKATPDAGAPKEETHFPQFNFNQSFMGTRKRSGLGPPLSSNLSTSSTLTLKCKSRSNSSIRSMQYQYMWVTLMVSRAFPLAKLQGEACLEGYNKWGERAFVLEAIRKQLRYFAGRQIQNTATPAGNIVPTSPISNLNPLKTHGVLTLPITEFLHKYRTTALPAEAMITKLTIPLPAEGSREVVKSYKQAKRKDDDIAILTLGFRVILDECGIKYDTLLEDALAAMEKDFPLGFTEPCGMPTCRKTLAFSFLFRFWNEMAAELELGTQEQKVDHEIIEEIHRGVSYRSRDNDNPYEQRVVGKQIPHLSGLKQATGEAEYIDDMSNIEGQLFGGRVLSGLMLSLPKLILHALQIPGVVGYVDINDLENERNLWGSVVKDDPCFAKGSVHSQGQPIGMIYAESTAIAQAAAQLVDVQYEGLPPILTISEAIGAKSFFQYGKMLIRGKPTVEVFKDCDFVFEGVSRMGGQKHFYLETGAAAGIARPEDELVAQVTGVSSSKIVAKVKRIGGGFGGKESKAAQLACILAVAMQKVGRPVRCMLDRAKDIYAGWKVGVSKDGMLQVLDADIDSCYWIPHTHLCGHVCKTNTHSNTAFRQYIAECIMTTIADSLKVSVDELRWKNLYKEGQLIPFLQPIKDWHKSQTHLANTPPTAASAGKLDVRTGSHTGLRTDIKMDVGRSINPAIDYCQIEGAFVQGQGLFTMEETLWHQNGQLFTRGPGTYKIPGFADIPKVFNLGLLKGVKWDNLRGIQSSKGIGGPPLFLGASAVNAARESAALDPPATVEDVQWAKVEAQEGEKGFYVEARVLNQITWIAVWKPKKHSFIKV